MPLQPQPISITFTQGLNTKVDPWQIPIGQFASMENSVFTTGGQLQKRNGYGSLPSLPNTTYNYLSTLNDNLTAIGKNIAAYNESIQSWVAKGNYQPISLKTLPLVRNSLNQTQCDSAIASNGLICTVYTETDGSTISYKYVIANSETGQNIVPPTNIPPSTGVVTGSPRVFLLGNYFVIIFTNVISTTSHLQYISISSLNTSLVTTPQDIVAAYVSSTTLSWDGVSFSNRLYIAYNTTAGGQSVNVTYLSVPAAALGQIPETPLVFASSVATLMSLCVDSTISSPLVYVSFYDSSGHTGHTATIDLNLNVIHAPALIITSSSVLNITSAAQGGVCSNFLEISNSYSYDSGIKTNFIQLIKVTGTTISAPFTVIRSLGLGSKAFIVDGIIYFLGSYQSEFQSSYFLINGLSSPTNPIIVAKLAYENGGGYLTTGLPEVIVNGSIAQIPYLYKDLIEPISTNNDSQQSTSGGVYAQTGVNLVSFDFDLTNVSSVEIANGLQIGGGFGWLYDGVLPVEQNFFLFPENIELTASTTDGFLTAQEYFYQVIYQWTDNQGNLYQSAGSIPVSVTTTGTTSSVTVNVPTLRLTYKTNVKVVIYRWSTAQQIYFQVTSISVPTLSSRSSDSISFVDTLIDGDIDGNSIIYTNGGVVEDINPPSSNIMTLFDTRGWLVDAEDPNLLWYSKQIIEATPVEWSDLFTFYVAPNAGTVSSTGPITALAPMDDKLIIFKSNAMYYINGIGPDNTGLNSQYNGPIFITSTVGCSNPNSIVFIPGGLMFQSNKGIWLLGRDGFSTQYIGSPVEKFNSSTVESAVSVPQSTQVKFTLSTGETLLYDYFYNQWDTEAGNPTISSCIYQSLHSTINSFGEVFQETPGKYLDGTNPVVMSFETGWINLAAIQGFQRLYEFYLIGKYLSPHKLVIGISYNYNDSIFQTFTINPNNFSSSVPSPYGDQPAPFGSPVNLEEWKINPQIGKCQSFKLTIQEVFDPSFGTVSGPGLTLSGLNMIVAVKRASRPLPVANQVG